MYWALGSPFVSEQEGNRQELWLSVDYRYLNKYSVKDKTPLPLMNELASSIQGAITRIALKAAYNLI